MSHLDPLPGLLGIDNDDVRPLTQLQTQDPVWGAFESMGYHTVAFQTGFD
jgi:hypothetical protein